MTDKQKKNIELIVNEYKKVKGEDPKLVEAFLMAYTIIFEDNENLFNIFFESIKRDDYKECILHTGILLDYITMNLNVDGQLGVDDAAYASDVRDFADMDGNYYDIYYDFNHWRHSDSHILNVIVDLFNDPCTKGCVNHFRTHAFRDCMLAAIYRNISAVLGYKVDIKNVNDEDLIREVTKYRDIFFNDPDLIDNYKLFCSLNGLQSKYDRYYEQAKAWLGIYRFMENYLLGKINNKRTRREIC